MTGLLTTPAVLDRMACDLADHDALVTADRSFTFAGLREEVRHTAAAIAGLGVRPGDRVALWSPNTWHWVVASAKAEQLARLDWARAGARPAAPFRRRPGFWC